MPLITAEFSLSSADQGILVGMMGFGCIAGALVGGYACDYFGRLKTISLCCIIFSLGACSLCFSNGLIAFCIGRFIVGVGVSVSAVVDVSYLSEVSPNEYRGAVISCNELFITVGILLSYVVNTLLGTVPDGWRIMMLIPFPLSAMWSAIIAYCMPESPRWLLLQNETDLAMHSFREIYGTEIEAAMNHASSKKLIRFQEQIKTTTFLDFVDIWKLQLFVVLFLMFAQQFTGNAVLLAFMPEILGDISAAADDLSEELLFTVALGVVKLLATILALFIVDKFGRRPLLLVGITIMTIGWALVYLCYSFEELRFFTQTGFLLVVAAYSVGFGTVSWVIVAEMFPDSLRSRAIGFAMLCNWTGYLIILTSFMSLADAMGETKVFLLYLFICMFSFVFANYCLAETHGKNFSEINGNLRMRFDCFRWKERREGGNRQERDAFALEAVSQLENEVAMSYESHEIYEKVENSKKTEKSPLQLVGGADS